MRTFTLKILVLAPSLLFLTRFGLAQEVQTPDQQIQSLYEKVAADSQGSLRLSLTGFQKFVPTGSSFDSSPSLIRNSNLFLKSSANPNGSQLLVANLEDFEGIKPTYEIVADGQSVWTYRPDLRTYSLSRYDGFSSQQNPNYRTDFFSELSLAASASGKSSYLIRLARELFRDATQPKFQNWIPGSTGVAFPTYAEPYPGGPTHQAENHSYLIYTNDAANQPKGVTVAYDVYSDPVTKIDRLDQIWFLQRITTDSGVSYVQWCMSILTGNVFQEAHFSPYPPDALRGWRQTITRSGKN